MMDVMEDCEMLRLNLELLPPQPVNEAVNEERRILFKRRSFIPDAKQSKAKVGYIREW